MNEGAAAPSYKIRSSDMCDRGTEACLRQWRIKAGGASGIARSDFATMRVPRKAASRFLDHFLAVRAAYKKMMFYPLQECVSRLAATDRQQYLVDGLNALRLTESRRAFCCFTCDRPCGRFSAIPGRRTASAAALLRARRSRARRRGPPARRGYGGCWEDACRR